MIENESKYELKRAHNMLIAPEDPESADEEDTFRVPLPPSKKQKLKEEENSSSHQHSIEDDE